MAWTYKSNDYQGRVLELTITETVNNSSNSSTLNWKLESKGGPSTTLYYQVEETTIKINGSQVYHCGRTLWSDKKFPAAKGSVSGNITIKHNADGTIGDIPISFTTRVFYNGAIEYAGKNISLTKIPTYTVTINAGTGSKISVNRTASGYASTGVISNGTRIYTGDKLKITFSADANYSLTTHTMNGTTFESGNTCTVSGNVAVVSTATQLKSSITASNAKLGEISTVKVTRYNSSFTHTITYRFGSITGTICTKSSTTSFQWTVPIDFYSQMTGNSGTCTLTIETFNGNNSLGTNTTTMTFTAPSKSIVGATDANIGSVSTITVTRYNSNLTHTITYSFGGISGTICTKSNQLSFAWTIPTSFYTQLLTTTTGKCTLTIETFSGSQSLGTNSTFFICYASSADAKPTAEISIFDARDTTSTLTGNNHIMVMGQSTAFITVTAKPKYSAQIKEIHINGVKYAFSGTEGDVVQSRSIGYVNTNTFTIKVVDTRGNIYQDIITCPKVDYFPLTINPLIQRPSPTGSQMALSAKGNMYGGLFNPSSNNYNTLQIKYRYKESTQAYYPTSWTTINVGSSGITYSEGTYSTNSPILLDDTFDYRKAYDFQIVATDTLTTLTKNVSVSNGLPVFDWGKNGFNFNVPVEIHSVDENEHEVNSIKLGNTELTEAQLISLLALLS